ncbi:hypothetical protein GGF31_000114 [Allomyces arbusculus]|nr:hypothetical protein GGF31_000114 [Allomyces arbusculus]
MTSSRSVLAIALAVVVAVLACATAVSAQTAAQINMTAIKTRQEWCLQQTRVCTNVCAQQTRVNNCNYNTLAYQCSCKNGTDPTASEDVDLTIPYFVCLNYKWQPCIRACPAGNQNCTDTCNEQFPCGKVKTNPNVTATETTSIDATASATSTPTGITLPDNSMAVLTANAGLIGSALALVGTVILAVL